MIRVRDVTKSYGPIQALNGVSFEVRPHEVVGFLGPNGAGKTTMMKILTGILAPESGEVEIAGMDALENSLEVRRRIGYLPENNPLYTDMRVGDFLAFTGRLRGMTKDAIARRVPEIVRLTGLADMRARFIATLSKGYRQRVGIASALLADPDILILDEPTVGLDPKQITEIRELIRAVGERKTVLLCSHILPEVQATCSRILILDRGRVVADGTPEELTAKARGGLVIRVVVSGDRVTAERAFAGVPGVARVRHVREDGGAHVFALEASPDADPRGAVFAAAKDAGLTLLESSAERTTLEDVFLQLTTRDA